ncbi:MAG: tetratricopeptide repeat protein, partial [Pseudomonadota bacterium]
MILAITPHFSAAATFDPSSDGSEDTLGYSPLGADSLSLFPSPGVDPLSLVLRGMSNGEVAKALRAIIARYGDDGQAAARAALEAYLQSRPRDRDALIVQASWAIVAGDGDAAERALTTLRDVAPEDPRTWIVTGVHETRRDALDVAADALTRALGLNRYSLAARTQLAFVETRRGRLAEALGLYDQIFAARGFTRETAGATLDWASLLLGMGNVELAAKGLAEIAPIVEADSALRERHTLLLATVRVESGDPAGAQAALRALGAFERFDADAALLGLRAASLLGDRNAMEDLRELSARQDRGVDAAVFLAEALVAAGEDEEAARLYENAVARTTGPRRLALLQSLVGAHLRLGDEVAARRTLTDAVLKAPEDALLHLLQADFLTQSGDYAAALSVLTHAIHVHPDHSDLNYLYGINLTYIGEHEMAEDAYRAAVDADPRNAKAWISLAKSAHHRGGHGGVGRHVEVISIYEEALARSPGEPLILTELGKIAVEEGRHAEAKRLLEESAQRSDGDPIAKAMLAIAIAEADGEFAAAKQLIEEASFRRGDHVITLFARGRVA